MHRRKAMIIIASLLLIGFLAFLFLFDFNQTKQVSFKTQALNVTERVDHASAVEVDQHEELTSETADKEGKEEPGTENPGNKSERTEEIKEVGGEEEQLTATENLDNDGKLTLTEEIKEKVREVVEGAINLFKKDLQIVAIGDSLTQGVGDETESGGYVGILNHTFEDNHLNIKIENYGKRGNRTDQLLKRLENKKIKSSIEDADIVLVTIGANDIMKVLKSNITNLTLEPFQQERLEYRKRLTSIFNRIHELNPETQIYLIGFYNPFERHFGEIEELGMIMNNWNHAGQSVTEEFGYVNYIPVADLFTNSEIELLADDYFHPNTAGYKLIAKRVLENLNELSLEAEISSEDIE